MDIEQIYEQYFRDVYLYLRGLSADTGTAEELAQETFMKVMKSLDSFDGSKDIKAWLFVIARNTYYRVCRRRHVYAEDGQPEEMPDGRPGIIEQLADGESAFLIHQFLHEMREPYKEVFSLRVFGELSFEKIGELFGSGMRRYKRAGGGASSVLFWMPERSCLH